VSRKCKELCEGAYENHNAHHAQKTRLISRTLLFLTPRIERRPKNDSISPQCTDEPSHTDDEREAVEYKDIERIPFTGFGEGESFIPMVVAVWGKRGIGYGGWRV